MKRNGWGGDGWGKQGLERDAARIATALERIAAALETPAPQTMLSEKATAAIRDLITSQLGTSARP